MLAGVPLTKTSLARSAIAAVQRLAAAQGVKLAPPRASSPAGGKGHDRLVIVLSVVTILTVLAALRLLVPRLRRKPQAAEGAD